MSKQGGFTGTGGFVHHHKLALIRTIFKDPEQFVCCTFLPRSRFTTKITQPEIGEIIQRPLSLIRQRRSNKVPRNHRHTQLSGSNQPPRPRIATLKTVSSRSRQLRPASRSLNRHPTIPGLKILLPPLKISSLHPRCHPELDRPTTSPSPNPPPDNPKPPLSAEVREPTPDSEFEPAPQASSIKAVTKPLTDIFAERAAKTNNLSKSTSRTRFRCRRTARQRFTTTPY